MVGQFGDTFTNLLLMLVGASLPSVLIYRAAVGRLGRGRFIELFFLSSSERNSEVFSCDVESGLCVLEFVFCASVCDVVF